ncbi:putative RutC family protein bbp_334 [Tenacibaculum sp. 190524A02b]|uniref:RutC family protein bbp_334 n=1 Tax=Tenacibaculum vairaonense TaxID=3137860 RepID=A0ABP1FJT4_9FLAO
MKTKTLITYFTLVNSIVMAQTHSNFKKLFDPTPYGFCHLVQTPNNGKYYFISGQSGGQDLQHTLSNNFRTQVEYALKNIKIILDESDLKPEDIVKITLLIVDHNEEKLKIWNDEMTKLWKNKIFPASTLIPVPRLALDGMLFEIDAIAFKKN